MATINVRVDDELKRQADNVLSGIGLSMTSAMTVFLKTVVRTGGIPFDLRLDPYEAYVERALDEADEEAKHPGPRMSHEDFMKEMRAYADELSRYTDASV